MTHVASPAASDAQSPAPAPAQVVVLIPTLNEVDNINPLLDAVSRVLIADAAPARIMIVDGGSQDGTQAAVQAWRGPVPVQLVNSDAHAGLAGDILYGSSQTDAPVVVVMDADLSHPPEALPRLYRPVLAGEQDMVIGSRYVAGGRTPSWPRWRRMLSRSATALAWPLVNVKDPMAGFFAVRRAALEELGGQAAGFKIALEVLARSDDRLRVAETPITFRDRQFGQSKLGWRDTLHYFRQTLALAGGAVEMSTLLRFVFVGLLGLGLDLLGFTTLTALGVGTVAAHLTAFGLTTVSNYLLCTHWVFARTARLSPEPRWRRYPRFLVVSLLALFLRGTVLSTLIEILHWRPGSAMLLAILAAGLVNFVGAAFFVFPPAVVRSTPGLRWRVLSLALVAYSLLLRLSLAGLVNLLPEEAYYWLYSRHPDIGYLDHPPMVSWLIGLSTLLLGKSELAVRGPALVLWLVMAGFIYALTRRQFDKSTALRALLLCATLPIYFLTGLLMTPDAPLYACWAGTLYFSYRVLVEDEPRAWWGVGLLLGLGLLSKYSIALLGMSGVAFMLLDRQARRWWLTPWPYVAAVLAAVVFAPVLLWNAEHQWASFAFQGPRRWSGASEFSLHLLLGEMLLVLTPLGAVGAARWLWPGRWGGWRLSGALRGMDRRQLWALVFTLAPLAVFVMNSLRHAPKINWTGPVWLALLPLLAWKMGCPPETDAAPTRGDSAWWKANALMVLLLFGAGTYFIVLGLPGVTPSRYMRLPVAWRELGQAVEQVEEKVEAASGHEPLLAGLDKYFLSSQIAFYDPDNDGVPETYGRDLFGGNSLMFSTWQRPAQAVGRTIIVLDFDANDLESQAVTGHFARVSPVQYVPVNKQGRLVGGFYYRVGYDYQE